VAGFDVSYVKEENTLIAGMVLLSYPSLVLEEKFVITDKIQFPYVPGYLSFREAPVLLRLIRSNTRADVFVFDGHGIAHPRGLGIAAHIGVLTQKASIGCAKKKLTGDYEMPGMKKGDCSDLVYKGIVCGSVLRTKDHIKPVFVSVGHLVNLKESVRFILCCTTRYRLPEPTRLAHLAVTEYRKKLAGNSSLYHLETTS
jgi:deoxyribonuclease V